MPSTPDPTEPEGDKLELPSLGGLMRRRKKAAATTDAPDPEPTQGLEPTREPDGETQPVQAVRTDAVEPTSPPTTLVEQLAGPRAAAADVVPPEQDRGPVDHGPDLVAPDAAYAEDEPVEPAQPTKTRRRPSLPSLPSFDLNLPILEDRIAVPLTGVLTGLLGVLLTYLFQSGCGVLRGAGSCGGVGLPLLIVVLVLMVFAGSALLRAWYVEEPLTTSFLAVALVAVVSMLVLLPIIDRWFMVLVVPVLTAAAYWLSWYVTSRFDAPEREAAQERADAR